MSKPSEAGSLYEMLSAEVDALRTALESHAAGEAELLAANAELRRRVEAAETAVETASASTSVAVAKETEAREAAVKAAAEAADARSEAAAAVAHAAELAAALAGPSPHTYIHAVLYCIVLYCMPVKRLNWYIFFGNHQLKHVRIIFNLS